MAPAMHNWRGKLAVVLSAAASVLSAAAAESPRADAEVWNEGVDHYRAGDATNALRVLRPLMLSKSHGARAAEAVAKLEYERGNLEEAANAAQIALRANPDDARANRNFTRATDGLQTWRETRHVNEVLEASRGKDPGALMLASARDARSVLAESAAYRTNAPAAAVARADDLRRRAEKLADAWIVVRESIAQSVTNREQAATILAQIGQAQSATKRAAEELGDLSPDAFGTMSGVEHDFTRMLKLAISPPDAIGEGLVAQSNAWQDVEAFNGRQWQPEALDYTRAFRGKFPAWARAYEQQAQADTNREPFTAETQAKIAALATELEKIQLECCEKSLPPRQEQALELLREIRELLPKDKQGGGGQSGGQQQNNPQPPDKQQQPQPQERQDSDQRQQEDPSEAKPQSEPQPEAQPDKEEDKRTDHELEALLKKAQERNDEHEADKKARMRKAPLPPNERDW